jgi:hypothetical protein
MLILEASTRQARALLVHLLEVAKRPRSNILFKDPLQSILVKGVAIETSPAIHIKIMA